jgi:hypothetical protein
MRKPSEPDDLNAAHRPKGFSMASRNGKILDPPEDVPPRADASASVSNHQEKSNLADERERFRNAFRTCLEENRVPPDRSGYYVGWAKEFVDFLPEKRLKAPSAEDIRAYLDSLSRREGISARKLRRAEYALRVLYESFLPGYSPGKDSSAKASNVPPAGEGEKVTDFRDRVLPGEVERRYPALIERFRTEVRTRHYPYRTETAYLEWARRFIAFHGYADPDSLEPASAIKQCLEYLALKREVSASTQNQALNALVFL